MTKQETLEKLERRAGRCLIAFRALVLKSPARAERRKRGRKIYREAARIESLVALHDSHFPFPHFGSYLRELITGIFSGNKEAWFSFFYDWAEHDRLCFASGKLVGGGRRDRLHLFGVEGFERFLKLSPFGEGARFVQHSSPASDVVLWKRYSKRGRFASFEVILNGKVKGEFRRQAIAPYTPQHKSSSL